MINKIQAPTFSENEFLMPNLLYFKGIFFRNKNAINNDQGSSIIDK
ncbi:hypothetical protein LEP1GSC059_2081 [Leptospira noguchii serovar Panama str. CZ214]|uniref:Uncharacterized protein n=1 Tax=Leptospira noguchii serovar Panama str. CZ214 TaxID=1001595 RepID=T0FJH4_9LEPT|nr:hypothetical protein LEP1GSC059_2081 [Leptospira noguchii serovar Panama str. CZ214]